MRACSSFVAVLSWSLASALHAQVWTQLPAVDASLARSNHAGAYDFVRGRLVMFGGQATNASTVLGDTLEHDGTSWTIISTPVGPPPRWAHGMALDFARARVVLFGGQDAAGAVMNDTWEWDGSAWQVMPTAVAPSPRMGLAMTTDPFHSGVLVHGGRTNTVVLFRDLWRWSGSQWLLQDSTGPLRCAHSMAIDPHNGDLVLFGGWNGVTTTGDTWLWNGTWQQASIAGPPSRWGHRMASDLVGNRIVMSGGLLFGSADTGETWVFAAQQWFRLGDGPARYNHVLDHDIVHGHCVEAGGYPVSVLDVWSFGGAAVGTIQPFGQGCGSSVSPTLAAVNAPRLGTTLGLNTNAPRTTVYLLGFSASTWNTLALPLDLLPLGAPGCVLYVEPAMIDVAVPVAGFTTHTYAVPNNTALVGVEFFAQAMTADPAANPAGIAASNALAGTIGP